MQQGTSSQRSKETREQILHYTLVGHVTWLFVLTCGRVVLYRIRAAFNAYTRILCANLSNFAIANGNIAKVGIYITADIHDCTYTYCVIVRYTYIPAEGLFVHHLLIHRFIHQFITIF